MTIPPKACERKPPPVILPLAAFALLVCLRMPDILLQGRFWAEEGAQFFAHAWVATPGDALFTSFGGYLNLVANAATLAARWLMPLPLAPYLTIAIGLAFQLCPPLILLCARDPWLQPAHIRLASLLLVLLVPASEEIWLQTLHCQFELLLCCALILSLDTPTKRTALWQMGLLALAPLTGPVAIVLLPLFALRAACDRSTPRLAQTLAIGLPSALQMLFFMHAVPGRSLMPHPDILLGIATIRHLALPLLGVGVADAIAAGMRAQFVTGHLPWPALILPIPIFLSLMAASLRQPTARPAFWLLAAGAVIAVASYVAALGGMTTLLGEVRSQGRYTVVPQTLFYLGVLVLTATGYGWMKRFFGAITIWLLCVGAYAYAHPHTVAAHGPSWRHELALRRSDPTHVLQIWPNGWSLHLPPEHSDAKPGLPASP